MSKSLGFCVKMDMCTFTREHLGTRRCAITPRTLTTTLTPNTTDHCISVHIWISLGVSWMRSVDSLLINKEVGRGSSWSSLDLETLESEVSSGKSAGAIAKDRGWPSSSVRQSVVAIKRGDRAPRYVGGSPRRLTPELLDEIREFTAEEEHGRISLKIVSNRFTLSRRGPSHP